MTAHVGEALRDWSYAEELVSVNKLKYNLCPADVIWM